MAVPVEMPASFGIAGEPGPRWSSGRARSGKNPARSAFPESGPYLAPAGLALAGAGIAWHSSTPASWLVTGILGLAGAALEGWRSWLFHQYALARLVTADERDRRGHELRRLRLDLDDRQASREHEQVMLSSTLNDAHRSERLHKVPQDEVTDLARIEEAQELWSTPVAERTASLSIDLRDVAAEEPVPGGPPPQLRPRGSARKRPALRD